MARERPTGHKEVKGASGPVRRFTREDPLSEGALSHHVNMRLRKATELTRFRGDAMHSKESSGSGPALAVKS